MPDYTTVDKCRSVLPMIGSVTSVMSADVCNFIVDAETIVNAKVSKSYAVPVSPAPPLLATLATDLTLYRLLALRFFTQEQMNNSVWPDRFKEANETLDAIANGEMPLLSGSGSTIDPTAATAAFYSSTLNYQHTMTEDSPERSFVDLEKIEDIRAAR